MSRRNSRILNMLVAAVGLTGCGDDIINELPAPIGTIEQPITATDDPSCRDCPLPAGVLAGNITVHDERDIRQLTGYTSITGSLTILNTELTNLGALATLEKVGGDFRVLDNPHLESVEGLERLRTVGGSLELDHNSEHARTTPNPDSGLRTLGSLGQLRSIGGFLLVRGNHALSNLGLTSLQSVGHRMEQGGNVQISFNASLSHCEVDALVDQLIDNGYEGLFFIGTNRGACN